MPEEDRDKVIEQMAIELAETGSLETWREIALLLQYSGYAEANRVLDNETMRALLDAKCAATSARSTKRS